MAWNKVRTKHRREDGRKYVWVLAKNGMDYINSTVIGTMAQVESFCETERLHAVAQYNVSFDDSDNPFVLHL